MTVSAHSLMTWYVESPDLDVDYTDGGPDMGPVVSGYTPTPPDTLPEVVQVEYARVLNAYDEARCALGPDECAVIGGAVIGLHVREGEDRHGNETMGESFAEFVLVLLPQTSGIRAIAVCQDCDPQELYASRSRR